MATKFDYDGALLVCKAHVLNQNVQALLEFDLVVTENMLDGRIIVPIADCQFTVDQRVSNGGWFDPGTYTFAFKSEQHKKWYLNAWGIEAQAKAAA